MNENNPYNQQPQQMPMMPPMPPQGPWQRGEMNVIFEYKNPQIGRKINQKSQISNQK